MWMDVALARPTFCPTTSSSDRSGKPYGCACTRALTVRRCWSATQFGRRGRFDACLYTRYYKSRSRGLTDGRIFRSWYRLLLLDLLLAYWSSQLQSCTDLAYHSHSLAVVKPTGSLGNMGSDLTVTVGALLLGVLVTAV